MSAADVTIRRGDVVHVNPTTAMTGIARGQYIVLASGPAGLEVTPADGLRAYQDHVVIDPVHVATWLRGNPSDVDALPLSIRDVSTAPQKPEQLPPPKPVDVPTVLVSIYDARRHAYQMRRGIGKEAEDVLIIITDGEHINVRSGSRRVALFPEDLVDKFLGTPDGDGCYKVEAADEQPEPIESPHVPADQPRVRVTHR